MSTRTWHNGPPPHVGWWNASWCRLETSWRWWDGKTWSLAATPKYSAEDAAGVSEQPYHQSDIEWTDFYPENARVPRVGPQKEITYEQAKHLFDTLLAKATQYVANIFCEGNLCQIKITESTIKAFIDDTAITWYDADYDSGTYQEFYENFQKAFTLWKEIK